MNQRVSNLLILHGYWKRFGIHCRTSQEGRTVANHEVFLFQLSALKSGVILKCLEPDQNQSASLIFGCTIVTMSNPRFNYWYVVKQWERNLVVVITLETFFGNTTLEFAFISSPERYDDNLGQQRVSRLLGKTAAFSEKNVPHSRMLNAFQLVSNIIDARGLRQRQCTELFIDHAQTCQGILIFYFQAYYGPLPNSAQIDAGAIV